MIGVLRIAESEWRSMSLKALVTRYDAVLIDEWDRTALLAVATYNLMVVVANANGCKPPAKPKDYADFHPYRPKPEKANVVRNIGVLKAVGDALARGW